MKLKPGQFQSQKEKEFIERIKAKNRSRTRLPRGEFVEKK